MVDIIEVAKRNREYSIEEQVIELKKRGFDIEEETGKIKYFNANVFVRFITKEAYLIYTKDGYFYTFRGIVWEKLEEANLKRFLRIILHQPRYGLWTVNKEKEYLEALKLEVYHPCELNQDRNLVNLLNGTFNLDDYVLYGHSRLYSHKGRAY